MNYNVKPKLDGAGSTVPKVNAKASPTDSAVPAEEDIFIEIGPPGTTNAGESAVSNSGLALYTFKNSPNIPDHVRKTCIGWCSDDIYAKWPGSTGWEKLANCVEIDDFGKWVVESKMYRVPLWSIAPVIEDGDYNVVYFRNVAMTHVATEDYNNGQYPDNVITPSQACIDENNGKKWAVLRLAGSTSGSSQVPIFHLLVREVQKIINGKGYVPNNGCVIVGSFIGSSLPDANGIYKDYTIIADEMAKCTVFVDGESAATILDYIEYNKCNIYGLGNGSGTKISQHICGYGEATEFVSTTTPDNSNDYFPSIPGMMQNPWPNQQKTCESGFFVAFTGYNTESWGLGKAAIDLSSGGSKCTHLCSYRTIFAKDVTINDLSDEVISAYNPATSGGLWARYFCGSAGIWGEVKAKGLMCGQDDEVKSKVIPSEENLGRVGVYVDDTGNIIAVRSGIVTGNEAEAQYQYATWNDIIKSRTHEDWVECGGSGTPEHTVYTDGSTHGTYCVIFGYNGTNISASTEFMGCINYTRKMQFGEFGWACGEGYCEFHAITTVKTIFICTGDDGFTVDDAAKCSLDTVILYSGDRSVQAPILPNNVSICSTMTSDTQLAVTLNLDGIFNRDGDTYTAGQSANFTIPINIEQDTQDKADGIYYPDPTKKGTKTRWIPFQTTTRKLGFIGS